MLIKLLKLQRELEREREGGGDILLSPVQPRWLFDEISGNDPKQVCL